MGKIIDGKKISEEILRNVKMLTGHESIPPKLAIVLASNDEPSHRYVELKMKMAKEVGIDTKLFMFDESVGKDTLTYEINRFKSNDAITGVLIQLPFYSHLEKYTPHIVNSLTPGKDADGLTAIQQGNSSHFLKHSIIPATVEAILECLNVCFDEDLTWDNIQPNHLDITCLDGKNILIVNNSDMIGKPLAMILSSLGATTTIANVMTENLREHTATADIIVSATGQTNLISADMVKEGVIAIDVTSTKIGDKVLGDFIFDEDLIKKTSFYTPVPGGVGPLTIACLLRNLVK